MCHLCPRGGSAPRVTQLLMRRRWPALAAPVPLPAAAPWGPRRDPPHSPPPSRGAILGLPRPRSGGQPRPRPRPRAFAALPWSVPPVWSRRAVLSLPLRCLTGSDFSSPAWVDPFRSHLSCQPEFPARISCRSSIFFFPPPRHQVLNRAQEPLLPTGACRSRLLR